MLVCLLLSFSSKRLPLTWFNWDIVGFDINKERILDLKIITTLPLEVAESDLSQLPSSTSFSHSEDDLCGTDIF